MKSRLLWPVLTLGCVAMIGRGGKALSQVAPQTPVAPAPVAPAPVAPAPGAAQFPGVGFNPAAPGPTNLPRIHDPVMTRENGIYYLFGTGRGITVYTSKDRKVWQRQNRVFEQSPTWTAETIPGSRDSFWAPDISYFGGLWHLYYSVSTFGKNRSAIGLATNITLDSSRADFKWQDQGLVTQSQPSDNFNAIDPNLILDDKGAPWLAFGSFWGGIQLIPLDAATGKAKPAAVPIALATRPRTPEIQGSIEGAFVVRHDNFYYLFASFDFCCRGINSTYNIRVGRSSQIGGPFLDRDAKPMLEGGGTPVLAGAGRWHGPGHNAIFRENGVDYLVYHAYDGEDNGQSKLQIRVLDWDAQGWPQVKMDTP